MPETAQAEYQPSWKTYAALGTMATIFILSSFNTSRDESGVILPEFTTSPELCAYSSSDVQIPSGQPNLRQVDVTISHDCTYPSIHIGSRPNARAEKLCGDVAKIATDGYEASTGGELDLEHTVTADTRTTSTEYTVPGKFTITTKEYAEIPFTDNRIHLGFLDTKATKSTPASQKKLYSGSVACKLTYTR